ncbi:MAG: GtrA-like protein [Bacteroidetes bacterium ADurb.Bin408]|nr:MAG: GtrA-like protein [Bacteroidetes bacterium ADurb.Bin408]
MNSLFVTRFIKFVVVGFSGLFIDFGLTYLFKEKIRLQKYMANSIGFITAATSNYFLNRIWTFHSQNPEMVTEYGKFILISLIGLAINTFVLWLLVSKMKWHFYFSKLLAIGVVTLWNFSMNVIYTFS